MQESLTEYFEDLDFCKALEFSHEKTRSGEFKKSYSEDFVRKTLRSWYQQNLLQGRLSDALISSFPPYPLELIQEEKQESEGLITRKYLWKLVDGATIESVCIPKSVNGKVTNTLCISSQLGCAMDCQFCRTGSMGLKRQLSHTEILAQVSNVMKRVSLDKIVFMGMGEPLHNFENLKLAISQLVNADTFRISGKNITVSTSGLTPYIKRLGEECRVMLAVSLNASNNEIRDKLMPINQKYPLEQLIESCRAYPSSNSRRILFEYVMIDGVNDTIEDAHRVVELLKGIPSKVNLIPYNSSPEFHWKSSPMEQIERFREILLQGKVSTTLRSTRGEKMLGACGQLKAKHESKKRRRLE